MSDVAASVAGGDVAAAGVAHAVVVGVGYAAVARTGGYNLDGGGHRSHALTVVRGSSLKNLALLLASLTPQDAPGAHPARV